KDYDGTTSANATPSITGGTLGEGDTPNFSEVYANRNAGSGITLTPSGSVNDGNSGNNYSYHFLPVTTGVINQQALTITAVANTKDYDGTMSASATPNITSGTLGEGDTPHFSETYATRNAGTEITLTPAGVVADGNGGNNYSYHYVPANTGVINKQALTITAARNTKGYDG